MAFPESVLPIKHEWLIDSTWTDITSRTRLVDNIEIETGYSGEQVTLAAGTCSSVVFNRDQFFSTRVPTSTNYGKFSKNVQCRVSVTESTTWMRMADYKDSVGAYDQARVTTADKAVLDITGDIDVRIDVQPDQWWGGRGIMLAGKYDGTGNQRSWSFWIHRLGYLGCSWSTDGTSTNRIDRYSDAVISGGGRKALRFTLDVNNGAGGYTLTFYTSDSVTGTWTQLGSQFVTTSGTTSIFSSTSSLVVGTITGNTVYGAFSNVPAGENHIIDPFVGRIYRCQVYSGIAGTLVADMNATAQAAGTTSWSDGLATANTWTLSNSAEITAQDYRFWGEVNDIAPDADSTGTDVTCSIAALDLLSRLKTGSKSLDSSIYTNLIRYTNSAAGTDGTMDLYYPMEDSAQATRPSAVVGRRGAMFDCTFSVDSSFPGSAGTLVFSSDSGWASGDGRPLSETTNTGVTTLLFYFFSPATPAAARNLIFFKLAGGSSTRATIQVDNTVYRLIIEDIDGTDLLNTAVTFGTGAEPNDQWIAMRVMLTQNGANVDYEWGWYPVGAPVLYGVSGSYAGTIGRPYAWASTSFTSKTGWALAHVAAMREALDWESSDFVSSTNAYVGEFPSARFDRLSVANGVPFWIVGRREADGDPTAEADTMGAQTPKTLMENYEEIARVDGGYLYSPRDKFGVALRMKNSIINRETVTVDYAAAELSGALKVRDDPFFARNQVKAVRENGGSYTHTKTSGSMNINEPSDDPQGIGLYNPGAQTYGVEADEQLEDYAREAVFFGTWDELRYTQVTVQMERKPFLNDATLTRLMRALKLFDPITLTGLGDGEAPWLPPDDAELLLLGYHESLRNRGQVFTWNLMPYKPFRVNDLSGRSVSRFLLGPSNSSLNADITGSATSFAVKTPTGKLWKTGTVNLNITIGGEVMTVGSISGSSSPQTFSSVTRNVNNMATTKAHLADAAVKLTDTWYIHR